MPQVSTEFLNRTIYGASLRAEDIPPSSLSIRLPDLSPDSYVEIYNIDWGIKNAIEGADAAMDYASLLILRNEIFVPTFNYAAGPVINERDVVFHDMLTARRNFVNREFVKPLVLDDASAYLIIFTAPINLSQANMAYDCILTVKGKRCSRAGVPREKGRIEFAEEVIDAADLY